MALYGNDIYIYIYIYIRFAGEFSSKNSFFLWNKNKSSIALI